MIAKGSHHWFLWRPALTIFWPILTFAAGFALLYAGNSLLDESAAEAVHWLVMMSFIVVPAFAVIRLGRQRLDAIGLTEENWPQAWGAGAVFGVLLALAYWYRNLSTGGVLVSPKLDLMLVAILVPLTLTVAGEEMLFRGWLPMVLASAFGIVPSLVLSSLAYTFWPLAFHVVNRPIPVSPFLPLGYMPPMESAMSVVFVASMLLNLMVRVTGSLWASILASLVTRLALLLFWVPLAPARGSASLILVVTLALWAIVVLLIRMWNETLIPPLSRQKRNR